MPSAHNICLGIAISLGCLLFEASLSATVALDISDLEAHIQSQIGIESLIAYASRKNPDIQAARALLLAKKETYHIDTAYPDPQLMVTYYPEPIETRLGPQDWNANLTQAIPYPGKLSTAGAMAKADIQIATLHLAKTIHDNALAIREAVIELVYIRNAIDILNEEAHLFNTVSKTTENVYAQDRAALVDVLRSQSRLSKLHQKTVLLKDLETSQSTRLNRLLGRLSDASIGTLSAFDSILPASDLDELYQLAVAHQEDILKANVEIAKRTNGVALARYGRLPDFKLGLFYAGVGTPDVRMPPSDAGDDAVGIQFGLTLPLWSKKNNSRIQKAQADVAVAKAAKTARVDDIMTRVRSTYYRIKNTQRTLEIYEDELLPQAQAAIDATETWFMDRKLRFSDFIDAQSLWYDAKLDLARIQADYQKDVARLLRLIGKGPDGIP